MATKITLWTGVLGFLTIQYYVWNEQPQVENAKLQFRRRDPTPQDLYYCVVVWLCVLLLSQVALQYQQSLSPPRRLVGVQTGQLDDATASSNTSMAGQAFSVLQSMVGYAKACMACLYSDTGAHTNNSNRVFHCCKVQRERDSTRSFILLLRRYNLVQKSLPDSYFFPGLWPVAPDPRGHCRFGNYPDWPFGTRN